MLSNYFANVSKHPRGGGLPWACFFMEKNAHHVISDFLSEKRRGHHGMKWELIELLCNYVFIKHTSIFFYKLILGEKNC